VHGLIVGGAHPHKQAYLRELEDKVRRAGLAADITFTGQRADLKEIMAVSDLVLSLSTQPESFGRTVLEALSLGVPVVGYDRGGVGEVMGAMLPAGLVPPGEQAALAGQAREFLARPPDIPGNERFLLDTMLASNLVLYQDLARRDGPAHCPSAS
jgi:glycosyltransferase involved in cell wall biosynthesis